MNISQVISKVQNSEVFKVWNKKDNYLVSCLFLNDVWSLSFYSKKTKRTTSFSIKEEVEIESEDKAFQKNPKHLEKLDIDSIKMTLGEAEEKVNKIKQEKAPSEDVSKKIIILQQQCFPVWNITYITSSFNILNVKINAVNKDKIYESFAPVFSLRKDLVS